ncbi:MAG: virulence factor SrfC family protein, partial [Pseudomonadota bacterium]
GAHYMDDQQRPEIPLPDGSTRRVFDRGEGADTADTLPAQSRATHTELWTDWVFTLEALFVGNAMDSDAGAINIEQNLRIGQIVNGLGR